MGPGPHTFFRGNRCPYPPPPTNIFCATSSCRAYIPPTAINLTIASCHHCRRATCTLCGKRFHAPKSACPAERIASGLIYTLRAQYLKDMLKFGDHDTALFRANLLPPCGDENLDISCGGIEVKDSILRARRMKLEAERLETIAMVNVMRQERIARFVKDMADAEELEDQKLRAKMARAIAKLNLDN